MDKKYDALNSIYFKLQASIFREEKAKSKSLLWTLINFTEKKAEKYIYNSSVSKDDYPEDILFNLRDQGYLINYLNDNGETEYILSAKGIWVIDKQNQGFSDDALFEFLQQSFFSFASKKKPLDDKDKLVVFSLIALRSFSPEVPMDLSTNKYRIGWNNIMIESFDFLKTKNIFKNSYANFSEFLALPGSETEDAIKYIMRRRNDLSIKTDHIFNNPGNSKYWLDIFTGEHLNNGRLMKLLKLIITSIPNIDFLNEINQFLNETYRNKGKYVLKDMSFLNSKYDDVIVHILKDIYVS